MTARDLAALDIPDFALVVLIGASGSGKSSFAARHFKPTEIVFSDRCRALVGDDETDQSMTADAFALVRETIGLRLKNRRLTVVDATNVRAADRKGWIELARTWHALPVAIVLDMPEELCIARNKARPDRAFGGHVVRSMVQEIRRSLNRLEQEGFRRVWRFETPEAVAAATLTRSPLWTDRRSETGPFDIIGDVHGCTDELEALLDRLGYRIAWTGGEDDRQVGDRQVDDRQVDDRHVTVTPPPGRTAIFVGDLVDRGPRVADALRIAMAMVAAGTGHVIQGNHERKLGRWLAGRKVQPTHGLQASIDQLSAEPEPFRRQVAAFIEGLRSHAWLDGGRLAVAHAGLKAEMVGRASGAVREFALYGDSTGETDEFGLPVRLDWARDYRGPTAIVYGHTPVVEPAWVNNTLCIDTGCVFGGRLTALRWPEKELVSVPAARTYAEPARPLAPPPQPADDLLDIDDVLGRRWVETRLRGRLVVAEENAAAALEATTRFALPPRWLVYLPPTMSPVETSAREGWLERPEEAFAHYRKEGVATVVCQEKHMGSRAIVALGREPGALAKPFAAGADVLGAMWTRTGRAFFADPGLERGLLERLAAAAEAAGLWRDLDSDWALLDTEIMPWSAKAGSLIAEQYAPVATAAGAGLAAAAEAAALAAARGVATEGAEGRFAARLDVAQRFARAWAPYAWPVRGVDDLRVAPFQLLAAASSVLLERPHDWHMGWAERLAAAGGGTVVPTRWRPVDLADPAAEADAIRWWEELTAAGGEGMVVKPLAGIVRGAKGLVQPAVKVRGKEYLRLIYGPEYDLPEHLARLRGRSLGAKRALALKEFALGHEALARFVGGDGLRRVHECVFAVLALESEPVDPRL